MFRFPDWQHTDNLKEKKKGNMNFLNDWISLKTHQSRCSRHSLVVSRWLCAKRTMSSFHDSSAPQTRRSWVCFDLVIYCQVQAIKALNIFITV